MSSDSKAATDQHYKALVMRFKQLHNGQDVLSKLGHLVMVGTNTIETKIFGGLKSVKSLLSGSDPLTLNAKLTAIEGYLVEYDKWLQQANSSLTPYGLRQYIREGTLKRDDLMALARFLITRSPDSIDDRGKLELTLSELCKNLDEEDKVKVLTELFPDFDQLTYAATEAIKQLEVLIQEIESVKDFTQFVSSEYLSRVRRIKNHFSNTAWNPKLLLVINELNHCLDVSFTHLFKMERKYIIDTSKKLLSLGINSIGKLGESGVLNVEAAARLAEKSEDILTDNYQTNVQRIQQIAQVGQWLRNAMEVVDTRENTLQEPAKEQKDTKSQMPRPVPERDSKLTPISTVLDYANIPALEQQILDRMEDLAQILRQRSRRTSAEFIQLKRTTLLLGSWEVSAIISLGNLVAASFKQQYDLIRRAIAIVAELQESVVVFSEGMNQKKSSYQYSVPATIYILEQAERCQGELETLSQKARQKGDTETALNLLVTRGKVHEACQKMVTQFKTFGLDVQ